MNILIVDDEAPALRAVEEAVGAALPGSASACFRAPGKALEHARAWRVDIAFLDINMGGMSGIELARKLKFIRPKTNIIFVTGYSQYAVEAYDAEASDFLLKPPLPDRITRALKRLRDPVLPASRIRVQTFGNFEVFADGKPVVFSRMKAKELLAYLVDRQGAGVTKKELSAVLWEDGDYSRSRQSHLQKIIEDMVRSLTAAHAAELVIKHRNVLAVDRAKFDCDYYRYLGGDVRALNAYTGEYMKNYSWAEYTGAYLSERARR